MAGYRAGYEKQKTNARLNGRMHKHLDAGGQVEMSVATSGTVVIDGERRPLDLGRKVSRLLAEGCRDARGPAGRAAREPPRPRRPRIGLTPARPGVGYGSLAQVGGR